MNTPLYDWVLAELSDLQSRGTEIPLEVQAEIGALIGAASPFLSDTLERTREFLRQYHQLLETVNVHPESASWVYANRLELLELYAEAVPQIECITDECQYVAYLHTTGSVEQRKLQASVWTAPLRRIRDVLRNYQDILKYQVRLVGQ